jgi:Skp family chaperone for outer membrane proteins
MDDHCKARSADVRKLIASAAVCGLTVLSPGATQAQQAPAAAAAQPAFSANAGRFGIAVVDVSYIFKNYPRFTAEIEKLKTEMEAADGTLKADRDRLVAMEQQRDALKPGSPDFKQLDEELARQKANFSIKQGTIRRDFLEREAKIYFSTYSEVSAAVKHFAQQNNIGMVLRFNGDQIDPQQREDVMRAIMQPIVFQNNVDITPDVLQVLSRVAPSGAAPTATRPAGTVQK